MNQRKPFLIDLLFKLPEHLCLLVPKSLHHLFLFVEIGLIFEDQRDLLFQGFDQRFHLFFKGIPLPRRKADHMGHVRVFEVIDVAEIIGNLSLYIHFFQNAFDGRKTTGPGQSSHKDIVPDAPDIEPDTDGLQGSILTDDLLTGRNGLCGFKGQ